MIPPLPGTMDCDAIVASGLKGIGDKKLRSMDDSVLRKLVGAVASHLKEDATIEEMVKELMKYKRATKKRAPPCKPQENEVQLSLDCQEENTEDGPVSSRTRSSIFKKRQVVRICAFNSLKLRLEKEGLEEDWEELLFEFADMDVLLISEVRASKALFQKRALQMVAILEKRSGRKWVMSVSEASGPGIPEVHIVLAKHPIEMLKSLSLVEINNVKMAHAPHVVMIDPYPDSNDLPRMVVTSVHLPPEGKRPERDLQITKLINTYAEESSVRLDTPFTDRGAKDARQRPVVHIIGGDFNAWVGDPVYGVEKNGFEYVFGKHTDTTAGGRAFDNFVMSENTRNHYSVSARVLEFARPQNSARGQIGLSDHSPVLLELEL